MEFIARISCISENLSEKFEKFQCTANIYITRIFSKSCNFFNVFLVRASSRTSDSFISFLVLKESFEEIYCDNGKKFKNSSCKNISWPFTWVWKIQTCFTVALGPRDFFIYFWNFPSYVFHLGCIGDSSFSNKNQTFV